MDYHRTTHRTFEVPERPTLRVMHRSGEVSIVGEDREDIDVVAQFTAPADNESDGERRLDAMKLPMRESGGTVEIGPPEFDEAGGNDAAIRIFGIRVGLVLPGRGLRIDLQIRVPRHCRVEAHQRSGRLRLSGVHEDIVVETRSGRTELSDLRGSVQFEGRSGAVEVRAVEGDVNISVRSGRVEVEKVTGDVDVVSRSGRLEVRNVTGRVRARARTGRIRVGDVDGPLELSATTGAIEYRGRITHAASIDVTTGAIRLAVTPDSSFFVDAETQTGKISADLPVGFMERPPEDAPTVRIRARTGAIRIVAAALGVIALPGILGAWQLWAASGGGSALV